MNFADELALGIGVMLFCFLVLSGVIAIRQRNRRRKSIHWLSVFMLSCLIGVFAGLGARFTNNEPANQVGDISDSLDLNQITPSAPSP